MRPVDIDVSNLPKSDHPGVPWTYPRKLPTPTPTPNLPSLWGQVRPESQPTFKMQMIFGPFDRTNSLAIFAHLVFDLFLFRHSRGGVWANAPTVRYSNSSISLVGGRLRFKFNFILNLLSSHILPNRIQPKSSPQTLLEKFTPAPSKLTKLKILLWKRTKHI